jgi:hypothetical protein
MRAHSWNGSQSEEWIIAPGDPSSRSEPRGTARAVNCIARYSGHI